MDEVICSDMEEFSCVHQQLIAIYNGWSEQKNFCPLYTNQVFSVAAGVYEGVKFIKKE